MAALIVLGLGCAATPAEAAGKLHVVIDLLPCPARARLARRIERRSADFVGADAELALLMNAEAPGRLTLKLIGSGAPREHTLAFAPSDCPELANTVVLLVRSWLTSAWDAPAPPPPPLPAPEDPPRLPVIAEPTPTVVAPVPPPAPPRWLSVAALGGLYAFPGQHGPDAAMALQIQADVAKLWGFGVVADYHAPARAQIDAGQVTVAMWSAGLVGYLKLALSEEARLELAAGPAWTALIARSEHYARELSPTLQDIALFASVRVRVQLSNRVAWVAAAEVEVKSRPEELMVVGSGRGFTISPGRASLLMGLAFGAL